MAPEVVRRWLGDKSLNNGDSEERNDADGVGPEDGPVSPHAGQARASSNDSEPVMISRVRAIGPPHWHSLRLTAYDYTDHLTLSVARNASSCLSLA